MNGLQNGLMYSDNFINGSPWIDFSNNSTIVGWSSFTTKEIKYKLIGNIVYVNYFLSGTSNSTATSFTLPFTSLMNVDVPTGFTVNATSSSVGGLAEISTNADANKVTFYRYTSTTNVAIISTWTNSGTKTVAGQFFYQK